MCRTSRSQPRSQGMFAKHSETNQEGRQKTEVVVAPFDRKGLLVENQVQTLHPSLDSGQSLKKRLPKFSVEDHAIGADTLQVGANPYTCFGQRGAR